MNSPVNKSPLETGRAVELTTGEQMDIIVWSSSPTFLTVCKLLENIVLNARDEAMAVDPALRDVQYARMTEAHGIAAAYHKFRNEVDTASATELAKLKEKANRELAKDQDFVANALISSVSGN